MKISLRFILGLMLVLSLTSSGMAAVSASPTFDLDFSTLNAQLGTSLANIDDIEYIDFFGLSRITFDLTQTPMEFSETGFISLTQYHKNGADYDLSDYSLNIRFLNLSGTFQDGYVTFQPHNIFLFSGNNEIAGFSLIESGGLLTDLTYGFTLQDDPYSIFSEEGYQAAVLGFNIAGAKKTMIGQISAVPIPGTLILIGSGLIGIVGFRKKNL